MLTSWRIRPCFSRNYRNTASRNRSRFRAESVVLLSHGDGSEGSQKKKKVVVVGDGWAGLAAAHHLCHQGFDVTVLDGNTGFGSQSSPSTPEDVGISGFWYPFRNIFGLVDDLNIKPFTNWTSSAHYSTEGLEVEFPIFQDQSLLPAPLGTLIYAQFARLSFLDRFTSLPLMAAVIDFDNTDTAWRKYDSVTARELFRQFGCSERMYRDVFGPLMQVGLFAPAEQCSAAATLAILYYLVLAHQKDFDVVWCRGSVREKIFEPWKSTMRLKGADFLEDRMVTDFSLNEETGCISKVVCGGKIYEADAVVLAVGISTLQSMIKSSVQLRSREEFLKVLNLAGIDVVTVKLQFDRKVIIPRASNTCSGFDDSFGWTFFDLNAIYDKHKDESETFLEADFYHANELMAMEDERIIEKAIAYLSRCIKDIENVSVTGQVISRYPKSLTHFFPGSYKNMMRAATSFPNLFMAGDWIISRHGSWSQVVSHCSSFSYAMIGVLFIVSKLSKQEKCYVTGLEAANLVVDYVEEGSFAKIIPIEDDYVEEGSFAKIIPIEDDEPHIEMLRRLNRFKEITSQLPLSEYFL